MTNKRRKIMKKNMIALLITLILLLEAGCSKASNTINSNTIEENNSIATNNITSLVNSDDDSQSYWNVESHSFAKGEKGYYFLSKTCTYIMYFDPDTQQAIKLCGKPDCKHNDNTCNAYNAPLGYQLLSIWYYKNYIYMIKYANGNAILEQINSDGSARKDLFEIGVADESYPYNLVFNENYVYIYSMMGNYGKNCESEVSIRKVLLDGKTDEKIFAITGKGIVLENLKSYGNKLFFLNNNYNVNTEESKTIISSNGLYAYDYNTKNTEKIIDKDISDFTVDLQNSIIFYYVSGEGIYKYNINTSETNLIYTSTYDTFSSQLSYDGKYLYMSNRRWQSVSHDKNIKSFMWIMDSNGNIKNKIETPNRVYFGDEKYMFCLYDKELGVAFINKNNIENETTWTAIK